MSTLFGKSDVSRRVDSLALLWVVVVASTSVVNGNYGSAADDGWGVLQWYVLAALYAGASWLADAVPRSSFWRWAPSGGLLLGAYVCLRHAHGTNSFLPAAAVSPISWQDWAVLGLCFFASAAARWMLPDPPSSSSNP